MKETAQQFFDACETGKGWHTDWMKGLFTPVPDASYEVKSFAVDESRKNVAAFGVFRGTHTGSGGPVPPTGKKVEDGISLKQLGWA
jgi:predicted ester cyclase